jgi:hypothetical protein
MTYYSLLVELTNSKLLGVQPVVTTRVAFITMVLTIGRSHLLAPLLSSSTRPLLHPFTEENYALAQNQ